MMYFLPFIFAQELNAEIIQGGFNWIEWIVTILLAGVFGFMGWILRNTVVQSNTNAGKIEPLEAKVIKMGEEHDALVEKVAHIDKTVTRTNTIVGMIAGKMNIKIPNIEV